MINTIITVLCAFDLSMIPLNIASSMLAFGMSFAVMKQKVKVLEKEIAESKNEVKHIKTLRQNDRDYFNAMRQEDIRNTNQKFEIVEKKREELKDQLISEFHELDKKITEIHTIIVTKK